MQRSFSFQDLFGIHTDVITYDTETASRPLFGTTDPHTGEWTPFSDPASEREALESAEACIHHRRDSAARAGSSYELDDADRQILARLHWLEQSEPHVGHETPS